MARLAHLVESSVICKGIRLYGDVSGMSVDRRESQIEKCLYQEIACLRDNKCSLLVNGNICQACHGRSLILKHRHWRVKQDKEKDIKKVNVKFLTGDDAKERLRVSQEEKKVLEKKLFKLRARIKKKMWKKKKCLSEQNLEMTLPRSSRKTTLVQKLFWAE